MTSSKFATQQANKFTFTASEGSVQIIFFPQAPFPGPIHPGQEGASELQYQGKEGNLTFLGDQIEKKDSPLGLLITVVLERSVDAGALTLTLIIPLVNLAGKKRQTFHTVAIKTKSFGILPREGAELTYEVLDLKGVAESVILPL